MTRARLTWNGPRIVGQIRDEAARGLFLGGEHILGEAKRIVPLDEATLERSGMVSVDAGDLKAAVSFSTPYAVRQHEDLTYRHLPGRAAKFLERPMLDEAGTAAEIIAATIRRGIQ